MAKFECKELAGDNLEVGGTKFFKLLLWSEDEELGLKKEPTKTFISACPLNHQLSHSLTHVQGLHSLLVSLNDLVTR